LTIDGGSVRRDRRHSLPAGLLLAGLLLAGVLAGGCTGSPGPTLTRPPASTPTPTPVLTQPPTARPSASASPTATARPTATVRPTSTTSHRPTPTPSPTPPEGAVVATFEVVGEEFRILLTDPVDIVIARRLLDGKQAPRIPNGRIVRGETGVNVGWSWSIDPDSLEFADATIEVCDGLPSHVEDGTLTGDRFCPWSAEVVAIEPAG